MRVLILTKDEHVEFISDVTLDFIVEHDIEIGIEDFEPFSGEYVWEDNEGYDIGISFMYTYKVPKEEIENHTWFNFHPAPLPEYKGRNLCYHAIMNGEREFGATVHYMDENFDTGDIIWVERFKILPSDTAEDVSDMAIQMSKTLFKRYFPIIIQGKQFSTSKNEGGHYYKKEHIVDEYDVSNMLVGDWIRAITYKDFYPKLNIHGVTYKVVRE